MTIPKTKGISWFLCRCGFNFIKSHGETIDGKRYCWKCAWKIRKINAIIDLVIESLDAEYEDYADEDSTQQISRLLTDKAAKYLREKFPYLSDGQVDGIIGIFESEASITWERWREVDGPYEDANLDFSNDKVVDRIAELI